MEVEAYTVDSVQSLDILTHTSNKIQDGAIAYVGPNKKEMRFDAHWIPQEIKHGELKTTLYQLSKGAIAKLPALTTEEQLKEGRESISTYAHKTHKSSKLYVLSCKDNNYYTLLSKAPIVEIPACSSVEDAVIHCAQDLGDIVDIDLNDEDDVIEVWIRDKSTKDIVCMLMYPAESFIVTYGG